MSRINNYFGIREILFEHDSGVLGSTVSSANANTTHRSLTMCLVFPKIFTYTDPLNSTMTL